MYWYNPLFNIPLYHGSGKRTSRKLNRWKNNFLFQITFTRLLNITMETITIDGLPDTISERVFLQSLIWYGSAVAFKKNGGLFILPGIPTGNGFNIYGDCGEAWVYSIANGQFNEPVKLYIPGSDENAFLKRLIDGEQTGKENGVIIWDNAMRYPFINTIIYFADSIADSMRTLDVSRFWLKRPVIFGAEESTQLSIDKTIKDMEENNTYTITNGLTGVDKTQLFNTNVNGQSLADITALIEWYENKFREFCGIDSNTQMDKKGENLITAEVTANQMYESISLDTRLHYINLGLDLVNKFFNTNMHAIAKKQDQEYNVARGQQNFDKEGDSNDTGRTESDNI